MSFQRHLFAQIASRPHYSGPFYLWRSAGLPLPSSYVTQTSYLYPHLISLTLLLSYNHMGLHYDPPRETNTDRRRPPRRAMTHCVQFFTTQIEHKPDPIPIQPLPLYDSALLIAVSPWAAQTMDDLDATLSKHKSWLLKINPVYELLSECLTKLIEAHHVLHETAVFFHCMHVLCNSFAAFLKQLVYSHIRIVKNR